MGLGLYQTDIGTIVYERFPQIRGNKDSSILESKLGPRVLGNYHIVFIALVQVLMMIRAEKV